MVNGQLSFVNEDGEGGIRTHGGVTPTPVFETGLFNRSSTSPRAGCRIIIVRERERFGYSVLECIQRKKTDEKSNEACHEIDGP